MLNKFMGLANIMQGLDYFINGLKSEKGLGTVIEALVFKTSQIMGRITSQLSDLQLICLYQAGQISKTQLKLSDNCLLSDVVDLPMSLLRVFELIDTRIFHKVQTLHALLANGIMDFLVAQKDTNSGDKEERRILVNSIFSPASGV